MQLAYRIAKAKHARTSAEMLSGSGALHASARWHTQGHQMVYTASSVSLATLEMAVHLSSASLMPFYRVLEIEIPERIIGYPDAADLPAGWDYRGPPLPAPQLWGDRWLDSFSSAVICVPSAVVPSEVNYLLNPLHGDFAQINVPGGPKDYPFDPRIKS